MKNESLRGRVTDLIEKLCRSPENRLWHDAVEPAWSKPLVGMCRADDEIFLRYKEAVGAFHWTPQEAYRLAFPDDAPKPEELAVVAWVLPQTENTKRDNRAENSYPAERWARSRIFGEAFNDLLRKRVAEGLTDMGYPAVAPKRLPDYGTVDSEQYVFASKWSERHMAHAASASFSSCPSPNPGNDSIAAVWSWSSTCV